jgi:hypothetical protein
MVFKILAVGDDSNSKLFHLIYMIHLNIFNLDFLLSKVSPADEGEYICQVSAYKPSDLTHKLAVRGEKDSS